MNDISKQYYKFLNTLQKIFLITNTKEIKVNKIDQGVICFRNQRDNNIEISIANHIVNHCPNGPIKRMLFHYNGTHITDEGKYDKYDNTNGSINIALAYNEKGIDFFSFITDCIAIDYNHKKGKELKKTLNITQFTLYLKKFITDPEYSRQLYNNINSEGLVKPLIGTMGQIKNFLERNKMRHFNRLSVDRENKTISFGFVSKEVTISKSDISIISKNRYNIDYFGSIIECLHKDIEFGIINTRQYFTVDQFYKKLLSYNKKFDCLKPIKSAINTVENQEIDKSSEYVTNTEYNIPLNYTQTLIHSSTECSNLIPNQSNSNEQQSTALLVAATLIPGALIFLAFILAYYCYCRRNSNKVRTNVRNVESTLLNNKSNQSRV